MSPAACPACGCPGLEAFHSQPSVPAHSCLLLGDVEEARRYPRGAIDLGLCTRCGFVTNTAFDARLTHYSTAYEETQGFSPRFRDFAEELAWRWIDRYDVRGRDILEIGCGKGEFLAMMCDLGGNRGIGIDPSFVPQRGTYPAADRLGFLQELYGPEHARLPADVIICRHTLEHIGPVAAFLRLVRSAIGDRRDVAVLFEVPDVLRVLREGAFWDVYYEHCSYFTPGSLARLFRGSGFEVVDVRLDFDDQYIVLEALPAPGPTSPRWPLEDDLAETIAAVARFTTTYRDSVEGWRRRLGEQAAGGGRTAIWGAGSKGVAYLNALGDGCGIDVAVDINPYKQGMYLAGTGTAVVAPRHLVGYRPDSVVVMNPTYTEEIRETLAGLGLEPELSAV